MGFKNYKPTTPGRRGMSVLDFSEITTDRPERKLLDKHMQTGGRNAFGRITSRFRGGGVKRRYRIVDFRREKLAIPARVATIEYDPNRSARIALLHYGSGWNSSRSNDSFFERFNRFTTWQCHASEKYSLGNRSS